ncbi:hypothetical protein B0T10DRAFT_502432 [Thelonectria olida]|uniref:Uncharacterized protein n=1 Tax=Thelonectria olida TaxID=1576542 RepID=A0A9P8VP13_9HYPO|nr:hypothetical protein B0T10DRAFT_502432 [Thelonectria olida]
MPQCFLTLRNGYLCFEEPERDLNPLFPTGETEWVKSDLDDIGQDVFQAFFTKALSSCPRNDKTPNFSKRYRSQCRLVNLEGDVAVRRPPIDYSDSPDDVETTTANMIGNHQKQPQISFMTVPVEIRLFVYRHLLISNGFPVICPESSGFRLLGPEYYDPSYWLHPQILATCRQINEEGTQILYSGNVFRRQFLWRSFMTRSGTRPWPRYDSSPLRTANVEHISRARLFRDYHLWFRDNLDLKVLQDFPSLRELQLRIDESDVSDLKTLLTRIIRAIRDHQKPILLKTQIRLTFNHDYIAWCQSCRNSPLSFSFHRTKKTDLETCLRAQGLVLDRELAWTFTTQVSQWCGPCCSVGFTFDSGHSAARTDTIKCHIDGDGSAQVTTEPA